MYDLVTFCFEFGTVFGRAVGEQIVRCRVDEIAAKVVALKKLGPEVFLAHFVGHVLHVLQFDGRIGLEHRLYVVRRYVVDEAVGAVRFRANVTHEALRDAR